MAYLERGPSVKSGRSHASSARSRTAPSITKQPGGDLFSNAASGVFSMLKTSTDSGDIGVLSFNTSRLPSMPRPTHKRRTNVARLSISSHHSNTSYTPSQISKRNSNSQAWDAVSAISQGTHGRHAQQGSLTSLQTMRTQPSCAPEARSPPTLGAAQNAQYDSRLTAPFSPDGRSYSLTQPQPSFALKPHRSATSLRSQGSGQYPTQRNQYAYPARLKRPGYRGPSPAFGDFGGLPYPSTHASGSNTGDGQFFEPTFERGQDVQYGRPYAPSQRPYNGPPYQSPERLFPPTAHGQPHGQNIRCRPIPMYSADCAVTAPPVPQYAGGTLHIPRQPISSIVAQTADKAQYGLRSSQVRRAPPFSVLPYGAQHHFHPPTYIPAADSLPSSSEQGSSAPPSSNPPTPRDRAHLQGALDSAYIDSHCGDKRDELIEPPGFPNYLKYAKRAEEICELDAVEPAATELPAEPPSAHPGFVQRIRDLLEDRSSTRSPIAKSPKVAPPSASVQEVVVDAIDQQELVELPAVRNSLAVEPGDPTGSVKSIVNIRTIESDKLVEAIENVEPAELEAPARLTRTMIKANTAPSSSCQNTATSQPSRSDGNTSKTSEEILISPSRDDIVDDSEEVSVTVASSPPQLIQDIGSTDTNDISRDIPEGHDELNYAVQLDLPLPLRPDPSRYPPPKSTENRACQVVGKLDGPVSPVRLSEEVARDSLVSPVPTQSLQLGVDHEKPPLPGAFPNEHVDLPSPQCRPVSNHLSVDTSTRFSLPPDLSLLNDHDATSEVVTDIAVRFSIPPKADHGKPQLVSVNSLEEEPITSPVESYAKQIGHKKSLRNSFFRVEKVAPLQIKKADAETLSHIQTGSVDLSSFIRRSFPRRQSVCPSDRSDSQRLSIESLDGSRFPEAKLPPGRLPGLKEDSQEDMSIKDYRSSGLRVNLSQSLQVKVAHEHLRRSDDTSGGSYLPRRAPRMTLSELRNIPSLNFSRLDLVGKLNEALEVRSVRSIEVVGHRDCSGIYCPSPLRPSSTEALREQYTSFFDNLEDFRGLGSAHCDITSEEEASPDPRNELKSTLDLDDRLSTGNTEPDVLGQPQGRTSLPEIRTINSSLRSRSPPMRPVSRPLSPEELVSVCHEVNHLSVPSVSALAERLSELLPSIRHLNLDSAISDDMAVKETLEEIHHLGHRPESVDLLRSSTGLRQLAAAADSIATNGTHDSGVYDTKLIRVFKEPPPLPEDTDKFSLSDSGLEKNTTLGTEAPYPPMTEIEIPQPALLRVKSLNDMDDDEQMHPGFPPPTTNRSLAQTTHHSRPWNLDEYYPWTGKTLSIDISFPRPVIRRNTSASTVLRGSRASDATSETSDASLTLRPTRARSPLISQSSIFLEASPTITNTVHSRKISKHFIMGSISRKIGLGSNRTKSSLQKSALLELSGPTKPGDRYPSTALAPHSTFNLDEVRSFFSDSTSEGSDKRGSFRKHYNILRSRLPGGPATLSTSRIHSIDTERTHSLEGYHPMSQTVRSAPPHDDHFSEPGGTQAYEGMVGMGKVEFRVKRVTERLKYVFFKTGEIIRTLSKRNPAQRRLQKERERAEWLDDSLYSGT